jgi:hypothetical protein
MQVACSRCGVQYEFEASAIPAQGYNAQCTHCGNVFFVEPVAPAQPSLVSVSCKHCGAVYQFEAAAIPAEGYDAQCTQCQGIFFVGLKPGATPTGAPESPPAVLDTPQPPQPLFQPSAASLSPFPTQPAPQFPAQPPVQLPPQPPVQFPPQPPPQPPSRRAAQAAPQAALQPAAPESRPVELAPQSAVMPESGDARDMLSFSAALGEPVNVAGDSSPEDDFTRIFARRRRRLMIVAAIPVVALIYAAVTYFLVPRLFDLSVGRLVGINLTVAPEAVPLLNSAATAMLADTEAGYAQASADLSRALAIDAHYGDAMSLNAMAQVFRGSDLQALGRERLSAAAPGEAAQATKIFEQGGEAIATGLKEIKRSLAQSPPRPLACLAAGLYFALDTDSLGRAQDFLRQRLELTGGPGAKLDLNAPPDAWTPFLKGVIDVAGKKDASTVGADFRAALKADPRLIRARWELAKLYAHNNDRGQAEGLVRDILTAVPTHAKAATLAAELQKAAAAAAAAAAAVATPPPTAAPEKSSAGSSGARRKGKARH